LDVNGDVQWQKTYGGSGDDKANSLIATADGGYAVTGQTSSFGAGVADVWVLKLDANGNVAWQKTYGGSGDDEAISLVAIADDGFAVAGWTTSFSAGHDADAWVLKLDASGTVLWQKTYGGDNYDVARSLVASDDGGFAVAGWTASFGLPFNAAWLLKLDAGGTIQWQKTYAGGNGDAAASLVAPPGGGYALAGDTDSFGVDGDAWVLKLDAGGGIGASCGLIGASNATVTTSTATVLSTTAAPATPSVTVGASSAVPVDSSATTAQQCVSSSTVHVAGLQAGYRDTGHGYRVGARLDVQDQDGQPVEGSTVAVGVRLPDGSVRRLAATTDVQGQAHVSLLSQQTGAYRFCVARITKAGYTYDPSQNARTCDRVTVP
jgi:hypothetical protein